MSYLDFTVPLNQIKKPLLELVDEIIRKYTFYVNMYDDLTVTVPAPASAPTLTQVSAYIAGLANATSYKVGYTYLTWNGETGLSPVVTFTATTDQGLAVLPIASLANTSKWAVGCNVYISNDGGTTYHKADGASGPIFPGQFAFGDDQPWGGSLVIWNAAGAAPPAGGTTATTYGSKTVSPPATAPTVTHIGNIPATTYYGAFCYLCGDGTKSALSAISSGVAIGTGFHVGFRINQEPPSGAVAYCRYLGTSATAGAMKLQDTVPLHHVNGRIFSYNSSGAAHSAGAAQSVVSGFQQAYDAAIEAGGGQVIASDQETEVPIILRLKTSGGTNVSGICIRGNSQDALSGTPVSALSYTGTQTGVVGILACGSSITWMDYDFLDPNSRVKYGMVNCDFYGGGGFESTWQRSRFHAYAAGGIGYQISILGASTSGHIASEQHFDTVRFEGKAWGIDVHGGQTGDLTFENCTFVTYGDTNSANSGNIRLAADFNNLFYGMTALAGSGEYRVFITADARHPLVAAPFGPGTFSGIFTDAASLSPFVFYITSNVAQPMPLEISSCWIQSGDSDVHALYSYSPVQLTLFGNKGPGAIGWINYTTTSSYGADYNPYISILGADAFFSKTVGDVKINDAVHVDYSRLGSLLYTSAYALRNAAGQQSLIKTNAAGDLILSPYAAAKVGSDAILVSGGALGSPSSIGTLNNTGSIGIGRTPSVKLDIQGVDNTNVFQVRNTATTVVQDTQVQSGGDGLSRVFNAAGTPTVQLDGSTGSGTFTGTVKVGAYTVATLPSGVLGKLAYVTDGDASLAWGATVVNTGGGATKYLVWYNGSAWTVCGK